MQTCKFCGSTRVFKNGRARGKQSYLCSECGYKFVSNESYANMKTKSKIIATALDLYYEGLSVRKVQRQIANIFRVYVSQMAIWKWIMKYSKLVTQFMLALKPQLSGKWHVDETVIRVNGENKWFWDVMDKDTRFLIASHISGDRTIEEVVQLFTQSMNVAKEKPKQIITDGMWAYEKGFNKVFYSRYKDKRVEHIKKAGIRGRINNNPIERLHGTIKDRTKVARGLKNTAKVLLDGWVAHYNFVRPHSSINKRPAQSAGLNIGNTWHDLIVMATIHKNKGG
ncbi:MAG: IS6 family transposase [Nitrososphaerales archaeon]